MKHAVLSVPTTELARHFGDYLSRVRFGGQTIFVMKNSTPVAELRALPSSECTLSDFMALWQEYPADSRFADDLAQVNKADKAMENPWD